MQRHVYWYGGSGVLAIADPLYYLMIYWLRSDAYTQVHKKKYFDSKSVATTLQGWVSVVLDLLA
jgi:hypothetical protein